MLPPAVVTSAGGGGGEWTVFYHSGFLGRAEPAVYMLEASGAAYTIRPFCDCGDEKVFACPAVKHSSNPGKVVSQTVAVSRWVGRECGFVPPDSMDADMDLKLALDIADVWSDLYSAARRLNTAAHSGYIDGRLEKWLRVLEAQCVGPYFNGVKPSYHDFLMVSNENLLEFAFGKSAFQRVMDRHPKLAVLYNAMNALPGIKALRDKMASGWIQGQPIWSSLKFG